MKIEEYLSKLKETDIYSLVMFALFKMHNIPEYASISELSYILDKENLFKLCEYFGGLTIRIPTLDELENMICALLVYQLVNIEHREYDEVSSTLRGKYGKRFNTIEEMYLKLCTLMTDYTFEARG
jgi:hypothetical protein